MPNRREEDTSRGNTRTHGHSHIPRMRNEPHVAHPNTTALSTRAYHENGLDSTTSSHNGKNKPPAEPPDNIVQSKQKEHGFETFVMTGDMIIRTTKKSDPARKSAATMDKIPKKVLSSPSREPNAKTPTDSSSKSKAKGSPAKSQGSPAKSQGSPAKSQGSPSKSLHSSPSKSSHGSPAKPHVSPSKSQGSPSKIPGSPSPSKNKKAESRIPMPSESRIPMAPKSRISKLPYKRSSPKHTPKQSPKLQRTPLSLAGNEGTIYPSMASPEPMEIENLEAVNNNVIPNVAKSEETVEIVPLPSKTVDPEFEMDLIWPMQSDVDGILEVNPNIQQHPVIAPDTLALLMTHPTVRQSLKSPLSPPEPVFDLELSPEVELLMEERMDEEVENPIHPVRSTSLLEAGTGDHFNQFSEDSIMSRSAPVASLGYMSFAGFRFPDVDMALDIPPDDISSEDDSYKNMESSLVDLDDLPPPPDELLQDLEKPQSQPLTPYPVSAILLRDNYAAATNGHKHTNYEPTTLETVEEAEGAINQANRQASPAIPVPGAPPCSNVISKSTEKIQQSRGPGVRYPTQSAGVRTSRSQENYFQNTSDGMALVDIDFDESMASSVDALPYSYSEKSCTSLDAVSMPGHVTMHDLHTQKLSRSLDNSPERNYDKPSDRMHLATFINIDQQDSTRASHVKPQLQQSEQSQPPPTSHQSGLTLEPHDRSVFSSQGCRQDAVETPPSLLSTEDQSVSLASAVSPNFPSQQTLPSDVVAQVSPQATPSHRDRTTNSVGQVGLLTIEGATLTCSTDEPELVAPSSGELASSSGARLPAQSPTHSSVGASSSPESGGGGSAHPDTPFNKRPVGVSSCGSTTLAAPVEGKDDTSQQQQQQEKHHLSQEGKKGDTGQQKQHPNNKARNYVVVEAIGARGDGDGPHIEVGYQANMVTSSGPPSPEGGESDSESIYHQPIKDVDRPSASRLAKRLFHNDGFKKQDISRHLHKKNDFAQLVGEEYLKFFDFTSDTLEQALRKFLQHLTLAGETQERERVLAHFSSRYMECNPVSFKSEDSCHTLTCALMLLNTDLHGQNIGRKMTLNEFIDNLAELNDGNNFPTETLKQLYTAIKTEPLECEIEPDAAELEALAATGRAQVVPPPEQRFIGHNPFLDVPDPTKATEYKKGCVMRKCCLDADGRRTPIGKRGWKMFYATLRDMVLYLHKDEHAMKKSGMYDNMSNAIRIHHGLATKAADYTKKQHVFRLHTSDGAQYLFQTSDIKECQEWMDTINFVAASFSAPPLPGGVGSQKKFQRPLFPSSYTKLNLREQLSHHEQQVQQREQDLHDHQLYPPEKGAKSRIIQDYVEKERFLQFETKRFKTYLFLLQAKVASFPELEPSLVEVAIGEVEEPLPSPQLSHSSRTNKSMSPSPSSKDQSRSNSVQRSMTDRLETKL